MKYYEINPGPPLDQYLQCFTVASAPSGYTPQRILPDGIVELVFHLVEPMVTAGTGQQPSSFVISQMKKPIQISSPSAVHYISCRFYPWGAYHFFSRPVQDFLDGTMAIKYLWTTEWTKFQDQLAEVSTDAERLMLLRQLLLHQLDRHNANQPSSIDRVIKHARYEGWNGTVDELGTRFGYAKKRLETLFRSTVGTTPKTFLRNARFLHACQKMIDCPTSDLTSTALELGYFDQAHFIHDFKAFCSMTPKQFVQSPDLHFTSVS